MKPVRLASRYFIIASLIYIGTLSLQAQENNGASFDAGADMVSNYIWRGTKFGTGPAVQPFVEFSAGNFSVGSWGSFGVTDNEAAEADLYFSYSFDFGLSLGMTDYYYPGTPYRDFIGTTDTTGSHGFEINAGYEISGFSISANYMLNKAGAAGTAGRDMYLELGYSFGNVSLFAAGGNGWHTAGGNFNLCNVGLSVSREIEITEKFSLPVSGTVIYNPDKDQYYVVFGISF